MRPIVLFLFLFVSFGSFAQEQKIIYERAFTELKGMLEDSIPTSFKRAVFVTEDAYRENSLSYSIFNSKITFLTDLCRKISRQGNLIYDESDKDEIKKYAAVFRLMTDTVQFLIDNTRYFVTQPYEYDFEDFWGEKDWSKMFVSKLLETNRGNCHSLPFLYKILVEELGGKAYLSMAPNHTYIKQWSKKTGWYNTELTSHYFPIDALIMASGYIHLSAVQNRIYMDTLSEKQSIAVCLVDLAKGFERKAKDDLDFIANCSDLALKYYPKYTNALILKAETTKRRFEKIMEKTGATYPAQVFDRPDAKALFGSMEHQYSSIHELGFRTMPKEMYINWLIELKRNKKKYGNKEIISNLKSTPNK
ncbi:MAG TPA: hypothetical protein VK462_08750 [Nitrososphaeraceae archaeon]|nr:hypothetical protein [Nitrososphaeraceae archaeon]